MKAVHYMVVVIKLGAYIHGCLFCVDAYYPDFTVYIHITAVGINRLCMFHLPPVVT